MRVVWSRLAGYVSRNGPMSNVVDEVIDVCEDLRPHPGWAQLRALEWDAGATRVASWWAQLLQEQPPPASIRGLWFGLCEPVDKDGHARFDLYASGTRHYDADDATLQWVLSSAYHPASHPHPMCLAETHRIARQPDGLGNDAEWTLGLVFGCAAVVRALSSADGRTWLAGDSPPLGVAAGWDGGDFIFLGELQRDRFDVRPRVT
jgi:hypothetical protein